MTATKAKSGAREIESNELARRAQGGCEISFETLALRFRPRLLTVLERRMSGRRDDAEDVVQETLARAWQKIQMYDDRYQFSTWVYTIAFRLATDRQRKNKRRSGDVSLLQEPATQHNSELAVQQKDEANNLWGIAGKVLNEAQYSVLWLRYGEDMDVKEIALATGRTKVGTRVILHRARKLLQTHMATKTPHKSMTHNNDDNPGGES